MTAAPLAVRTFTPADQAAFAAFSGDVNPMHVDAIAARRTQAGAPVVHGVHALLWALEALVAAEPALRLGGVRAQFNRFIYLDRTVEARVVSRGADTLHAEIASDGGAAVQFHVALGARAGSAANAWLDAAKTPLTRRPQEPAFEAMDGLGGWLEAPGEPAAFPGLRAALGAPTVTALALTSTVVGMACPGLNSIFSSLETAFVDGDAARPGLGWRARTPDRRYARIEIDVAGSGLRGQLKALVRPPPVAAPGMAELSALVTRGEFARRDALVLGGSRGLGAVAAKLLAAGGARVTLTYAVGAAEAENVVADIVAAGGEARAVACDVLQGFETLAEPLGGATHLYYFATPRISRPAAGGVSAKAFAEFNRVYVERFQDLCLAALAASDRRISVLYPSSIAVEDPPRGMVEYAMSKAAGELLCRTLARAHPRLTIAAPRLPRILTDQTALAIPVKAQTASEVLLPLLRAEPAA